MFRLWIRTRERWFRTSAEPSATAKSGKAVARLLEAWRGEVEARAVYTILAEWMRDPRRAQVIREIADGEARHRERIEKRLRELGQPIPDPSTVRIPTWLRLQARFARVMRMLTFWVCSSRSAMNDFQKIAVAAALIQAVLLIGTIGLDIFAALDFTLVGGAVVILVIALVLHDAGGTSRSDSPSSSWRLLWSSRRYGSPPG